MKDDQARTRIVETTSLLLRRIERLDIDRRLDRDRIVELERQLWSDHYLLQQVVADNKKSHSHTHSQELC